MHIDIDDSNWKQVSFADQINTGWKKDPNGKTLFLQAPLSSKANQVATITWTNLQNSSYNGKKIAKMVAVISNPKAIDTSKYPLARKGVMQLEVFKDPTDFIWYDNMDSVDFDISFYDSEGNLISFSPNSAYITIGSLNSYYNYTHDGSSATRVEGFTPLSGAVGKTLYNAGIKENNGSFYAPTSIDGTIVNGDSRTVVNDGGWGNNWDVSLNKPNAYFGSAVMVLNSPHFSYRAFTNRNGILNGADTGIPSEDTWVNMSTVIPTTPSTVIHYHYDEK